jgi:7,8-dihydroneopterin aldolase/epimerase/oxygenase
MALRSKWTVRIHRFETWLRVGSSDEEQHAQPVTVSLRICGLAETHPNSLQECFDYQPVCHWMADEWPNTPHTALLETRLNELVEHVFNHDKRVMDLWVGLYKSRAIRQAECVGLEREVSRRQFQEQLRHPALAAAPPTKRVARKLAGAA